MNTLYQRYDFAPKRVTMVLTLDALPEEVLDRIFRCLRAPVFGDFESDDIQAILAISLVSKKFHRIVAPILYQKVRSLVPSSKVWAVFRAGREDIPPVTNTSPPSVSIRQYRRFWRLLNCFNRGVHRANTPEPKPQGLVAPV